MCESQRKREASYDSNNLKDCFGVSLEASVSTDQELTGAEGYELYWAPHEKQTHEAQLEWGSWSLSANVKFSQVSE